MRIEELQSSALEADAELTRLQRHLEKLEHELEETGPALPCRAYGNLQSSIAQTRQRVESAESRAAEYHAQLDEVRSAEAAKLAHDAAERSYQNKLTALHQAQAEIQSKRQALAQVQSELPRLEQQASRLLFELNQAKSALQQSA